MGSGGESRERKREQSREQSRDMVCHISRGIGAFGLKGERVRINVDDIYSLQPQEQIFQELEREYMAGLSQGLTGRGLGFRGL